MTYVPPMEYVLSEDLDKGLWYLAVIVDEGAPYDYEVTRLNPTDPARDYNENTVWNDVRPKPDVNDVYSAYDFAYQRWWRNQIWNPIDTANDLVHRFEVMELSMPTISTQAHITDAATNSATNNATNGPTDAPTNAPTNYGLLAAVLGAEVNANNAKQNQTASNVNALAAIVNANATKQNTLATNVNAMGTKFNAVLDALEINQILAAA